MNKFTGFLKKKKYYIIIAVIILGVGGYFIRQKYFVKSTPVRYITAKVERGNLTSSISGTGQISVTDQVDIKAKVSGDVVFVGVKNGDEIKRGQLIAQIDSSDAAKSVRDAQQNLESAKLSLAKLTQPTDALALLQAENSLSQVKEDKVNAETSLGKAYSDGFTDVDNAFLDLPGLTSGLQSIIYGYDFDKSQLNIDWYTNSGISYSYDNADKIKNLRDAVVNSYQVARAAYDKNFDDYKATSRLADRQSINDLISETYKTSQLIADAIKNTNNFLDYVQGFMDQFKSKVVTPAAMTTHQSSLETYAGKINSHLTSLLGIEQTIENYNQNIVSNERAIQEKTQSLEKLKAGTDPLDLQSQQISIKQKENAVLDAQQKLADYYVRAPFDGVVASLSVKKGDSLSSGGAVATLITKQRLATISLNEIDVAKVKVGQKVTLTFDAVDGLSITGEVADIDALGTVSQGVVSYNIKIAFDIQDDRIKPGMSVSANIILSTKPDVLMVSSSAVKSQGGESYVEILVNGALQKKTVVVGSNNDTMTEIASGLSEGEEIITQKITAGTASTINASQGQGNQQPGGANAFRMLR